MPSYSNFSKPIQEYITENFPSAIIEEWKHEKQESLNFNIVESEKTYVLRVMDECFVGIKTNEIKQLLVNYNVAQVVRDIGEFPIVVTNSGCIFGSP